MQTRSMKIKERIASGTVLHKLPAEILGIIATQADNKGLASMRLACRELRDGSAFEFFRRYTSLVIELDSPERYRLGRREYSAIPHLEVETRAPDVVMAQAMTQSLIFPEAPNSLHVSLRNETPLRDRVPKRVAKVYAKDLYNNPYMGDFELVQKTLIEPSQKSRIIPLMFKRIATLVPQTLQLRELVLAGLDLDGDDLINLL